MKKLGLVAAVLMVVAAPVWASVSITCTQVPGTKMVTVSYEVVGYPTTEPNKVRGFALDITVNSEAKIIDVNTLNAKYNIYPGSIVITGNQITDYGSPVANPYDPCTLPGQTQLGLNSGGITIEMGSLYYPTGDNSPNAPPLTGTLLRFKVDKDCHVTVTENTVRGGVVMTNPNVDPVVNATGCDVQSQQIPPVPASITYPASDPDGAYAVSWAASSEATSYQVERSSDGGSTWPVQVYNGANTSYPESGLGNGSYRYRVRATNAAGSSAWCTGTSDCVVCILPAASATLTVPATDADGLYTVSWTASAGATSYKLESSAPASGTTIYPLWVQVYSGTALSYNERVGGGTWDYRVKATNTCGSSAYTNGSNSCVVSDCLKNPGGSDPNYAAWKQWRYPACWCCFRQCRGDINCKIVGTQYVQLKDLTVFKAAYTKTNAQLAAVVIVDGAIVTPGICADLNQSIVGTQRVQLKDLTEFKKYYTKIVAQVPCCDTAAPAGDCTLTAGDKYNYWMAQNP